MDSLQQSGISLFLPFSFLSLSRARARCTRHIAIVQKNDAQLLRSHIERTIGLGWASDTWNYSFGFNAYRIDQLLFANTTNVLCVQEQKKDLPHSYGKRRQKKKSLTGYKLMTKVRFELTPFRTTEH